MSIHAAFPDFVQTVSSITDQTQPGKVLITDAATDLPFLLVDEPFLRTFNFKEHYITFYSQLEGDKFENLSRAQQRQVIEKTKAALNAIVKSAVHFGNGYLSAVKERNAPYSANRMLEQNTRARVMLLKSTGLHDESEELETAAASTIAYKADQVAKWRKNYDFCAALTQNSSLRAYDSVCTKAMRQLSRACSCVRVPAFVSRVLSSERVQSLGTFVIGAASVGAVLLAKKYFGY